MDVVGGDFEGELRICHQATKCIQVKADGEAAGVPGVFCNTLDSARPDIWDSLEGQNESALFQWTSTGREGLKADTSRVDPSGLQLWADSGAAIFSGGASSSSESTGPSQLRMLDTASMDMDRFSDGLDINKLDMILRTVPPLAQGAENDNQIQQNVIPERHCPNIFSSVSFELPAKVWNPETDVQQLHSSISLPTDVQQLKAADITSLSLDYRSILDAWDERSQTQVAAEGISRAQCGSESADENNKEGNPSHADTFIPEAVSPTSTCEVAAGRAKNLVGSFGESARPRWVQLARYREKKKHRHFNRKVRYGLRKANADNRPRIKGRFVKGLGPGDAAIAPAKPPKMKLVIEA